MRFVSESLFSFIDYGVNSTFLECNATIIHQLEILMLKEVEYCCLLQFWNIIEIRRISLLSLSKKNSFITEQLKHVWP